MHQLTFAQLERHLHTITDILRSRLDVSACRDYLFALLFLKRSSDISSEWARDKIALVPQGGGLFVPRQARWAYIQQNVYNGDDIGALLNSALRALQRANRELDGVLDHVDFQQKIGKYPLSQNLLRDLLAVVSKYSLRNEDFAVPDLLGTAFEFLISEFSDAEGRRGGQCYTPSGVASLLARLLAPRAGMRIYDPCVGSGRLLLFAQRSVEEQTFQGRLDLLGQDSSASAWVVCKMNMILHGFSARIEHADTLTHPLLTQSGVLETFDGVISNPPFAQNYCYRDLPWKDRFRYGRCPDTGKKADLMFVQHMLAVTKRGGVVATVMPHGVLFRGGSERQIRRSMIEEDILEAVIGLPANLFYETAIPTCILVLRARGDKPEERRGKVLFINADAEFGRGRTQNILRPEDVEKIVLAFESFKAIPGYSSVVSSDELAVQDWNLNIRLYADNTPPPEPQDVRAHLVGGVPRQEVAGKLALFEQCGLSPLDIFVERDAYYFDFSPALTKRSAIRSHIETCSSVLAHEACLREKFSAWWQEQQPLLHAFPPTKSLAGLRTHLLTTFLQAISPRDALSDCQLAGVIAIWWDSCLYDLKILAAHGACRLVDSWIDAVYSSRDGQRIPHLQDMDVHYLELMRRLLPDCTQELIELEKNLQDLQHKQEMLDIEHSHEIGDEEEELVSWEVSIEGLEHTQEYAQRIKTQINAARRSLQALRSEFPLRLEKFRGVLSPEQCERMVSSIIGGELQARLDRYIALQRQQAVIAVELWWDKYFVTLNDLTAMRDAAEDQLERMLKQLGYYG